MALIRVRLQPRASSSRITGEKDGVIQVRVTAPPVDGEANAAVIELVAHALGVGRAAVEVVAGHSSRRKTVAVRGIDAARVSAAVTDAGA